MEHCKQGYESDIMETLSESSTTSSDDQDSTYSVEVGGGEGRLTAHT